jgi:hypothetical protein
VSIDLANHVDLPRLDALASFTRFRQDLRAARSA